MTARLGGARLVGVMLLLACAALVLAAPQLSPNDSTTQFDDRSYAPPMRVHLWHEGSLRAPFIYPQTMVDRIMRRFAEDRTQPIPLRWFANGKLLSIDAAHGPLLLAGADALGYDVWSRLLDGARRSLGVVLLGTAGAVLIGVVVGGLAGTLGGRTDHLLMLLADFVIILPGAYLVLVLRSALPAHLEAGEAFIWMALLFAVAAWPHVARGTRAIVATERGRDYAEAARASGAGAWRLMRQLIPAASGFLVVEVVLLVPALLVAEVTVGFLGLGFPLRSPSWGTMLQDVAQITVLGEAPWLLAPVAAMFVVTLALNLAGGSVDTARAASIASARHDRSPARHHPASPHAV